MTSAARARSSLLLPTSPAFVRLQAGRRGDAGGLVFAGRRYPFGALADEIDDLVLWLARRGVGRGHRVGVMAANNPAMVAMTYAVWGLGAVCVPIAIRLTAEESAHLLQHARAAALLCDAPRASLAAEAASGAGVPAYACEVGLPLRPRPLRRRPLGRRSPPATPFADGLAVIAYTSGTTGKPKGVMVSHGNLLWAAHACGQARGDDEAGVGACLSPLTHTPVFVSHLLCRILIGATAVLVEKFDAGAVLEQAERFRITDLPLIGGMVFDVVSRGSVSRTVRRCVEKVSVGGAATPMDAKRALAGIFERAEIIEAYGQSESTDGVAMARGTSVFDREGTVGRANPFVRLAVRRADGAFAHPGEEGEIAVAGPTVMRGYHRDAAATQAAIRDGWLYTGDLGRRDEEGYLFVTGRVKALIISGGENVSPVEVEEVLRQHPQVADVAVIGTPHPKWGEEVTAVVVARDGIRDSGALADFARARLAAFKRPRRWEFVEALPRNAANKVQTHVLRERFAAR
jgi:acyl-CoA synthetase (AMP-forming)/AMP-acid ligase II